MNRDGARPRRLRVSALAAVANPSYTRLDTWNLLDDACRHLAEVNRAGLDITHDVCRVKRLMDRHRRLRAVLAVPGCGESGDLPRSPRHAFDGAARRRGVAGRAPADPNMATAQGFSTPPRRWPTRSWWPRPNSSSSIPCCSPTMPRPRLPTAWPSACGRCATRPTMCSTSCSSCRVSRTPSPRSR